MGTRSSSHALGTQAKILRCCERHHGQSWAMPGVGWKTLSHRGKVADPGERGRGETDCRWRRAGSSRLPGPPPHSLQGCVSSGEGTGPTEQALLQVQMLRVCLRLKSRPQVTQERSPSPTIVSLSKEAAATYHRGRARVMRARGRWTTRAEQTPTASQSHSE